MLPESKDYIQMAAVPTQSTTHSGEDVIVLARGPMSHLFHGIQEQSYLAHAMGYAACVGADLLHCKGQDPDQKTTFLIPDQTTNGAAQTCGALLLSLLLALAVLT